MRLLPILLAWLPLSWAGLPLSAAERSPDFGRQVRPILAKHCFPCHGPDPEARESGLRLDLAAAATADLGGYAAIVPGDAGHSQLIARVTSDDAQLRMPPAESHPPLSANEIETLRRWIDSGAVYQEHWAFVAPVKPEVVAVGDPRWCLGPIDRFVLARIESASLSPAAGASRESLIRRLYLDLTGTTPAPQTVDRLLADDHPTAYVRLVDQLLASPEYAERFARPWLDLARYADTNGYEKDRPRTIWPYRDWVIQAIAKDMPLDQFSIEQLAGDMLPAATNDQLIATGFHRNTMLNEEGGIDPLEFRFQAMVDRVATTGTVWMGLTIGCAQCHTHKYDPITHTDYYALFALLNNADEPELTVEDSVNEQRREQIQAAIASMEQRLIDDHLPSRQDHQAGRIKANEIAASWVQWYDRQLDQSRRWQRLRLDAYESTMPKLTPLEDASILASGDVTKREIYRLKFNIDDVSRPIRAIRLEALPHESLPSGGPGMAFYEGRRGDFFLSEMTVSIDGQTVVLQDLSHSYGKISVGSGTADAINVIDGNGSTGWSTAGNEGLASQLVANFSTPVSGQSLAVELLFERHFAAALGRFRISITTDEPAATASSLPGSLFDWHAADPADVDPQQYDELQHHFIRSSPLLAEQRKPIDRLRASIPEPVRTLAMRERSPPDRRITRRHHRGEYLQGKEPVRGGLPESFASRDGSGPRDRLALACWLVSDANPLFARVTVNRAWREFFGTGIVDTAGDFGTQSEPPSHPLLIDYLATELWASSWSLKKLHREIVLSATYRQALAEAPPSDPRHRLVAGFPHRRLDAEQLRDALLSASGLLSRHLGGPSVYPPQPGSVTAMAWGSPAWNVSSGADRYRRSLYTFSKRTAPFAAYAAFDGPSGESCLARRDHSTTPLQALTLLNDAMYMEIAAGLAETVLKELPADATPRAIATQIFRRLLVRTPDADELSAIMAFYRSQKAGPAAGNRAPGDLKPGDLKPGRLEPGDPKAGDPKPGDLEPGDLEPGRLEPGRLEPGDLEPWKLVARALMNVDEAITTP